MARRPSRRSKSTTIDFSGVESRRTPDEGTYNLVVEEVTKESGDRADYFKWQFKISDGDFEGVSVYHNTSLAPQSLWNLKNLLEALGEEVPDGPLDIDLAELVGKEVSAEIIHEKYEGRNMARISEFGEADEAPKKKKNAKDDDDEEEEEKPRRGRRAKPADDDDEEDEKPKRRGRKPAPADDDDEEEEKPKRRGRRAAADDDDEEDEKPKRGAKKKPVKEEEDTITSEDVNGMSQEELEELIEEHDLDVKISSLKTLRKMRAAVIEAGEEAGIIED